MKICVKEILVQDVGDKEQIINFKENYLYRRPKPAIYPLYFAPYFTKKSEEKQGISFISKVLGVLTIKPELTDKIEKKLEEFATKDGEIHKELIIKWKKGLEKENKNKELTFYFLDKPIKLKKTVYKTETRYSKGWIGGSIPPNRIITFQSLIERM